MTEIKQDTLIFRVDFNNSDGDGRVKGSFAHARSSRVPTIGERVLLGDGESNECWATVSEVGRFILRFELDRATWSSGGEELTATGVPAQEFALWLRPRSFPGCSTGEPLVLA